MSDSYQGMPAAHLAQQHWNEAPLFVGEQDRYRI
jgi:hypothetical protein